MITTLQTNTRLPLAIAALFAAGALHAAPVIYEPFAQTPGNLNDQAAGTGLSGNWTGNGDIQIVAGNLLPSRGVQVSGNHAVGAASDYRHASAGTGTTLSTAGLLAPAAELWFSALIRSTTGDWMRTFLTLGTGHADGYGRIGGDDGHGLGVVLENGNVTATSWAAGSGGGGASSPISNGVQLVVGKIVWGATSLDPATLSIYLPGSDLVMPGSAASSLTMVVDQSTFNTISFAGGYDGTLPEVDEIRFGATYADVTPPAPADNTPPTPSPMTWASAPAGSDESQITMTATTATDENGVEYFFTNTTVSGHDSGWQTSPTYTDTGLTPATAYAYQVKARDLSLNANETVLSDPMIGTTLAADNTPPDPSPMTWATPPAAGSNTAISMTATTATDPHGVEYYFTNTTVSGHDSGWQASPFFIDTGLSPGTQYTYQVKARDKSQSLNETGFSDAAAATTDLQATTVIYEPFAGASGTLTGQTAGTGLTGTWNGNDQINVTAGSMSYGSLATSGNHAVSSGVAQSEWWNVGVGANSGTTLRNAGLLAPGAELWFSCLVKSTSEGSKTFFCFGDTVADGWGRMGDAGGVGFQMVNGTVFAYPGNGAGGWPGPVAAIPDGVNLIVGKITWGPDSSTSGSISIYLPGPDLALPATPASTQSTNVKFDQSTFDTISFAPGWENSATPEIDEIRFGGSYETVVVAGAVSDYNAWATHYPGADLSDPAADYDQDGLTNNLERIWGLDPTSASSVNPYPVAINPAGSGTGTFSYTRRNPALSGLTYTVWTSTTLESGSWTEDAAATASQAPGTPDANDIEIVAVTLSATPVNGKLFVRVQAAD